MRHVFLIGSNGIPASYGGFETFVEQLTAHRKDQEIFYHVSCLSEKKGEFEYNHARCFQIKVPKLGPAKVIYYDTASLGECCRYINITSWLTLWCICWDAALGLFSATIKENCIV